MLRGSSQSPDEEGWPTAKVEIEGDLVVARSLEEFQPSGDLGALPIHRRTASGWQLEDRLRSADFGFPSDTTSKRFAQ